ncbi:MAG: metallophosphoesterase family protein, partial [Acidobacteriota bacterium]
GTVRPDLLVVSGDLTQRAREDQFRAARAFLDRVPFPRIVVPGNHDVPLYDVFRRFAHPLEWYREYITEELAPFFADEEMAVLGINTARSLTWKNGRISTEQIGLIRERFCSVPAEDFKVLVTHHPFVAPPGREDEAVVGRAERMFLLVNECSPDLALAGHFHTSYTGASHSVYTGQKGSTLILQAGTAVSRRTRTEPNAWNAIRIEGGEVELTVHAWNGSEFREHLTERFHRNGNLWEKSSG